MSRSRWLQLAGTMGLALGGVFLVLFLADIWMMVGVGSAPSNRCLLQFPKWIGCVIANHENLSGGLFGAWGTVLAGFFAYMAAISETEAQKDRDATARAEAKFAAIIVLTQPVHASATALLLIYQSEASIASADPAFKWQHMQHQVTSVTRALVAVKETLNHFSIAQAWQKLSVNDQTNYLMVTATLHTLLTIWENPPQKTPDEKFADLKVQLMRVGYFLRGFDEGLSQVFTDISQGTHSDPPTPVWQQTDSGEIIQKN